MKNKELLEAWVSNPSIIIKGSNIMTLGPDKLYSYSTCIAQYYDGEYIINKTYYSRTTSRHVNYIIAILQERKIDYKIVTDVTRNSVSILKYL